MSASISLPVNTEPATAPRGASAAELRTLVAVQFGVVLLHDLPIAVLMLALLVRQNRGQDPGCGLGYGEGTTTHARTHPSPPPSPSAPVHGQRQAHATSLELR